MFLVSVIGGILVLMSITFSLLLLAVALLFFSLTKAWAAAALGISLAAWFLWVGELETGLATGPL